MSLFTRVTIAQSVDGRIGPEPVRIETQDPRQSGANCGRFSAYLAIPYQRRIDIRFVPIFLNASSWKPAHSEQMEALSAQLAETATHELVPEPATASA